MDPYVGARRQPSPGSHLEWPPLKAIHVRAPSQRPVGMDVDIDVVAVQRCSVVRDGLLAYPMTR
jgi:hypothetical protein